MAARLAERGRGAKVEGHRRGAREGAHLAQLVEPPAEVGLRHGEARRAALHVHELGQAGEEDGVQREAGRRGTPPQPLDQRCGETSLEDAGARLGPARRRQLKGEPHAAELRGHFNGRRLELEQMLR